VAVEAATGPEGGGALTSVAVDTDGWAGLSEAGLSEAPVEQLRPPVGALRWSVLVPCHHTPRTIDMRSGSMLNLR
jgi:hypothetical protein